MKPELLTFQLTYVSLHTDIHEQRNVNFKRRRKFDGTSVFSAIQTSVTQCILFSKVFNFRVLTELGKIPSVHFMIFLRIVVKDHFQLLL